MLVDYLKNNADGSKTMQMSPKKSTQSRSEKSTDILKRSREKIVAHYKPERTLCRFKGPVGPQEEQSM